MVVLVAALAIEASSKAAKSRRIRFLEILVSNLPLITTPLWSTISFLIWLWLLAVLWARLESLAMSLRWIESYGRILHLWRSLMLSWRYVWKPSSSHLHLRWIPILVLRWNYWCLLTWLCLVRWWILWLPLLRSICFSLWSGCFCFSFCSGFFIKRMLFIIQCWPCRCWINLIMSLRWHRTIHIGIRQACCLKILHLLLMPCNLFLLVVELLFVSSNILVSFPFTVCSFVEIFFTTIHLFCFF